LVTATENPSLFSFSTSSTVSITSLAVMPELSTTAEACWTISAPVASVRVYSNVTMLPGGATWVRSTV
ncbi:hypothetical protein, partial [Veronia pacifica]|uniref:hypothetical protein n=1 Tax=Veronia pacifica TaxID=1080227 RepID=UPI003637560F